LELNGLPPFLGNLTSDGQDGYGDAISYGSGEGSYGSDGQSGYDNKNSFKFVCINNNNNTVVVGEEPVPPIPPVDECSEAEEIEACFEEFQFEEDFSTLVAALESGITVEINGEEVTLRSFADICLVLESATTYDEIISTLFTIFREVIPGAILPNELTDCIAEALDIPIPPIET
jgi:hypothetical protein